MFENWSLVEPVSLLIAERSMELLNSLHYCQGGHENTACSKRTWQLGQQARWGFINLGGRLHETAADELGRGELIGLKPLCDA